MSKITSKEKNKSIKLGVISGILLVIFSFIPLFFKDYSLTLGYFISISLSYFSFFTLFEID